MRRIDQIFKLEYGTRKLGSNKGNLAAGGMPVIASGDDPDSFGVNSWKDVEATQHFCLTVARTGSAGVTYFRDYPCTPTDHCIVLTPLAHLSRQEMLWYQEALRAIRPMWSYGRTVTPEKLGSVILPDPAPWVHGAQIPDLSPLKAPKIIANDKPQIDTKNWHPFKLLDLFYIKAGGGLSSYDASTSPGNVPFVAASKNNNAVVSMTGAKDAIFVGGLKKWADEGSGRLCSPIEAATLENIHGDRTIIHLVSYRAIRAIIVNNNNKLRCFYHVDTEKLSGYLPTLELVRKLNGG